MSIPDAEREMQRKRDERERVRKRGGRERKREIDRERGGEGGFRDIYLIISYTQKKIIITSRI